ncbi:MAG: Polysaccharide biosynthesis protein [Candidatus Magasanikbacteria bacterium GW2011_GWA2_42_32]|uniref:Polysaccharide biosynthesis protein n=1 Tax=Candidatus Magasanikbacteria bacterium GW2011_GWA2_42_32 TaxID=1619039 RepID=A0A0G1D3W2_9BACT|nr:MAG: Polysaccharide biosynthesis protein [Candidatus Magasanikbacteria bacterium GW2011_GWA2_42_32]
MQVGTIFSTLVSIAASILLARILLPDQYGTYRIVFSFAGIILLFLSWGVENATPIILSEEYSKQNKAEIKNVITYFFKTNFYILILSLLAIVVAPFLSELVYGLKEIGYLSRIVILTSVMTVFVNLINIIFQIKRKVSAAVIFDFSKELLRVILSLAALFLGLEVAGVLKGQLLAALLAVLAMIIIYAKYFSKDKLLPKPKEIIANFRAVKIRKYFSFGMFISFDKNVSALYSLLPIFFLGIFYPSEQVAYLNIALKYITLPLILLAPISRLLDIRLPQMTAESDIGKLKRSFYKVSTISGIIVFVLAIFALFLAPFLIKLFYGENYAESVSLIYYLVPLPILSGFAVGIGSLFRVLNKLKAALVINGTLVVLGVAPVYLSIKIFGVVGMIIAYILWLSVSNLVSFLYIKRFLK